MDWNYIVTIIVGMFSIKNLISVTTLIITVVSIIKRDEVFAFSKKKVLRLFMHNFFSEIKGLRAKIRSNYYRFKHISPTSILTTVDILETHIKKNIYGIVDGTYGDLKNFSAMTVLVNTFARDLVYDIKHNAQIPESEAEVILSKLNLFVPDLHTNYLDIVKSPLKLNYFDILDMVLMLITILIHNMLFDFIER